VIGFLILLLMGIVNWTIKKHVKRLETLETEAARHTDIQKLRDDMDDRHEERKEALERVREDLTAVLDRIENGIARTHARIDELYRDMKK
jgi:predicted AAA+ superfamily ATPase